MPANGASRCSGIECINLGMKTKFAGAYQQPCFLHISFSPHPPRSSACRSNLHSPSKHWGLPTVPGRRRWVQCMEVVLVCRTAKQDYTYARCSTRRTYACLRRLTHRPTLFLGNPDCACEAPADMYIKGSPPGPWSSSISTSFHHSDFRGSGQRGRWQHHESPSWEFPLPHPSPYAMTRRFLLPDFVFPLHHGKFPPRPAHLNLPRYSIPTQAQSTLNAPAMPYRSDQTPVADRVSRNRHRRKRGQKAKLEFQYDTISET